MAKKVAVVLSGCGYLDGSEIRESVLTHLSLSQRGAEVRFFAPDVNFPEVNHLTNEEEKAQRNTLKEAARIARGEVSPFQDLRVQDFDALVMPGGFGAAKHLCDFAHRGSKGQVRKDLKQIILNFFEKQKPMGAICIAPALMALIFGSKSLKCTVGEDQGAIKEIELTGAKHQITRPDEICVDENLKIVTTPAYMYDKAPLFQVFKGIDRCVESVLSMA